MLTIKERQIVEAVMDMTACLEWMTQELPEDLHAGVDYYVSHYGPTISRMHSDLSDIVDQITEDKDE